MTKSFIQLSEDILDQIDGAEEALGRDSQLSIWAEEAGRLERIEQKYNNLCGVLNDQTSEISRLSKALDDIIDVAGDYDKKSCLEIRRVARDALRACCAPHPPAGIPDISNGRDATLADSPPEIGALSAREGR